MVIFISRLLYLLAILACIYFLIRFLRQAIKPVPHPPKRDRNSYDLWNTKLSRTYSYGTAISFKLKRDVYAGGSKLLKGTIYTFFNNRMWILATPKIPATVYHYYRHIFDANLFATEDDFLEEIDLYKEKKIHPHLNKEVKKQYPNLK